MKTSAAALSFLILAAALGSPAHGYRIHESLKPEIEMLLHRLESLDSSSLGHGQGLHRPAKCCFSYTSRKIRCAFMKTYFETTSGCPMPAVIFTTKGGQQVCANPRDEGVQNCVTTLKPNSGGRLGNMLLMEERH